MAEQEKPTTLRPNLRWHIVVVPMILSFPALYLYSGNVATWKAVVAGAGLLAAYAVFCMAPLNLVALALLGAAMGGLTFWAVGSPADAVVYALICAGILVYTGIVTRRRLQ